MITRSKLVEQLREKEMRSQQYTSHPLSFFSPSPSLSSRSDVIVAVLWSLVFVVLVVSSYVALYLKYFWLSFIAICLGILLPIQLKISRHTKAKKRDRRFILPLSM